jgi:hypothetical protein
MNTHTQDKALEDWTHRLADAVDRGDITQQDARAQLVALGRDLGLKTDPRPERYGRMEQELRAAGADLALSGDVPYITPESGDRKALSPEAAAMYDKLTAAAPGVANVGKDDKEIALHVLTFSEGLSETEALRKIALNPEGVLDEYSEAIASHRGFLSRQAHDADRRAFAESPAGRKLQAADAVLEEARELEVEANARVMLRRNPESFGIRAEDVQSLSRADVLSVSGIEPSAGSEQTRLDQDLQANLDRATKPKAPVFQTDPEGENQ